MATSSAYAWAMKLKEGRGEADNAIPAAAMALVPNST